MSEAIDVVPRSTADIVWDSLGHDEVTAVFEATEAAWPSASADDTVAPGSDDDEDAPRVAVSFAANDAPTQVGDPELARVSSSSAALLLQLAAEGYRGEGRPVAVHVVARDGWVDVGCECDGPWAGDAYLDAWHVRLLSAPEGVRVWDEDDRGGVWLRVDGGCWLLPGDRIRLGAQQLRFDAAEPCAAPMRAAIRGYVQLVVEDEPAGPAVPVVDELVLGRVAADVTFPHDPYVSERHCRLVAGDDDGVWIEDLSSSNGTWMRVRSGEVIPFGSIVAMGASLYRIESGEP